jgi:putative aldouronate transport system substrate-binding protein
MKDVAWHSGHSTPPTVVEPFRFAFINLMRQMTDNVSRRNFLAGALATGIGLPLLNACAPSAPSAPAAPAGGGGQPASKTLLPTYIPVQNGPKPDYHDDNPLFSDGFENYPSNPQKATSGAPGSGSTINALMAAYFPQPTIHEQNPTWQAVEKALNATINMNIVVGGADYTTKFATVMASEDLPDIMHIFFGYPLAPNLPDFFKAKCADLTPYLAGDAAKDYPYLAAIPTAAWKNSISAVNGALYLVPIHRPMFSIAPVGGNFFKNVDMWDTELGQGYLPKNADDFKRALQQLTKPQQNQWGIGSFGTNAQLFGLGVFAEMFNAPNRWKVDASGKLLRDRETEEYKAAIGYMRDLFAAGVWWPDSLQAVGNVRPDFAGKKFAVSPEGQGNSYVDFWQRGLQVQPPTRFGLINPFAAQDGQKPVHFLGTGFVSMNVLKKNSPEKIKEILRIMNWLAAPFGSQEDLLLTYGLKDQDYALDDKGNPKPSTDGISRAGYVPWRYIAQHPWVYYQADLQGFAKAAYDAEHATLPFGVDDPTNGYYSPTQYAKGNQADMAWQDGTRDIIVGRRPMSDYDQLVTAWKTTAGDQIRKEYTDAIAAAKA